MMVESYIASILFALVLLWAWVMYCDHRYQQARYQQRMAQRREAMRQDRS